MLISTIKMSDDRIYASFGCKNQLSSSLIYLSNLPNAYFALLLTRCCSPSIFLRHLRWHICFVNASYSAQICHFYIFSDSISKLIVARKLLDKLTEHRSRLRENTSTTYSLFPLPPQGHCDRIAAIKHINRNR